MVSAAALVLRTLPFGALRLERMSQRCKRALHLPGGEVGADSRRRRLSAPGGANGAAKTTNAFAIQQSPHPVQARSFVACLDATSPPGPSGEVRIKPDGSCQGW